MDNLKITTNQNSQFDFSTIRVEDPNLEAKKRKAQHAKWIVGVSTILPALVLLYHFLPNLVDYFTFELLNLKAGTHLAEALHFFIYDSIKIFILLFIVSSVMGIVNAYFPVERLRNYLTTKKLYGLEYLLASFFGSVTPFCSCSSIPLFIGFVKGGIPLGVTFAFLITSPLVNEVAVAMFLGMFGVKATLIYTGSGILMGMIGGYILGKLKLDRHLMPWVKQIQDNATTENELWEKEHTKFIDRLPIIVADGWAIVRKVWIYVLIGISIGALMHGYVPEQFFSEFLAAGKWYTVPLAVILAVPMYANASGIVPIIQVLVAKGVPLGTAIAFMMAVVGLSLPEATLLKKVMNWKLIAIFFGTITVFIILLGYFFNLIIS